jgi:bis(5'-nucleosyl)-tetraphosphatase (symmetrical)
MATYVVGDLQGCFASLQSLLDQVGFRAGLDRLWLVGDLVNRGPQSLAILRYVRDLGENAVCVLGNHDLHLLGVWAGVRRLHPGDTLYEVLAAPDADALLHWLRTRPVLHATDEALMVHAGIWPFWDRDTARARAAELESALRAEDFRQTLTGIYGSLPNRWDDQLQGMDRLRVITNIFTRMRYCFPDGTMDFQHKCSPDKAPAPLQPWFCVPGRVLAGSLIVCGHWSALGLHAGSDVVALDTGCLWGGSLSALRLEDRQIFRVPCPAIRSLG